MSHACCADLRDPVFVVFITDAGFKRLAWVLFTATEITNERDVRYWIF